MYDSCAGLKWGRGASHPYSLLLSFKLKKMTRKMTMIIFSMMIHVCQVGQSYFSSVFSTLNAFSASLKLV